MAVNPLPGTAIFDPESVWKNITFSRRHHGKKFKFTRNSRDNMIRAELNGTNQHIVVKQVIDTALLSKISIEFKILHHVQNSIIGLVEYPFKWQADELYGDRPLEYTAFKDGYFGLGTSEFVGQENVFRLWNPSRSNPKKVAMNFGFKDGDALIMVIDANERTCCVYVNQINERYLICNRRKRKLYTFRNIPEKFIIVYGAHAADSYAKEVSRGTNVEVKVRLLESVAKGAGFIYDDEYFDEDAPDDDNEAKTKHSVASYSKYYDDEYYDEETDDEKRFFAAIKSRPRSKSAQPHKKRKKYKFVDFDMLSPNPPADDVDVEYNYNWNSIQAGNALSQFRRNKSHGAISRHGLKHVHFDSGAQEQHAAGHKKKKQHHHTRHRHKKQHTHHHQQHPQHHPKKNLKKKGKHRRNSHQVKRCQTVSHLEPKGKHRRNSHQAKRYQTVADLEPKVTKRLNPRKKTDKRRRHSHHTNVLQKGKKKKHSNDVETIQDFIESLASDVRKDSERIQRNKVVRFCV